MPDELEEELDELLVEVVPLELPAGVVAPLDPVVVAAPELLELVLVDVLELDDAAVLVPVLDEAPTTFEPQAVAPTRARRLEKTMWRRMEVPEAVRPKISTRYPVRDSSVKVWACDQGR